MPNCPQCGGSNLRCEEDCQGDPSTGYPSGDIRWICATCGALTYDDEMVRHMERQVIAEVVSE